MAFVYFQFKIFTFRILNLCFHFLVSDVILGDENQENKNVEGEQEQENLESNDANEEKNNQEENDAEEG